MDRSKEAPFISSGDEEQSDPEEIEGEEQPPKVDSPASTEAKDQSEVKPFTKKTKKRKTKAGSKAKKLPKIPKLGSTSTSGRSSPRSVVTEPYRDTSPNDYHTVRNQQEINKYKQMHGANAKVMVPPELIKKVKKDDKKAKEHEVEPMPPAEDTVMYSIPNIKEILKETNESKKIRFMLEWADKIKLDSHSYETRLKHGQAGDLTPFKFYQATGRTNEEFCNVKTSPRVCHIGFSSDRYVLAEPPSTRVYNG